MPGATQDNAMLSSLVYGNLSVGQVVTNEESGSKFEVIALSPSTDGYQGAIFKDVNTNAIIVANAGTNPIDVRDLGNDGEMQPT